MTFLSELMVASKAILEPLEFVSLRVIKLSTLESVSAELFVFLTATLKLSVRFEPTTTPVAEFAGLNVTVGERVVSIDPLPSAEVPPTVIAKQLVYQLPVEVISKSLSIAIALDCDPTVPLSVTSWKSLESPVPPVTMLELPSKMTFPLLETKLPLLVQFPATLMSLLPVLRVPSVMVRDPSTSTSAFSVIVPEGLFIAKL